MWTPFDFFIGSWRGSGEGQPGVAQVERTYQFVLNDQFIHEKNKSTYLPQAENAQGEIHEDWGFISLDKARKMFVYRQFHVEGFINQYVMNPLASDAQLIIFETESIENIPPGWRAKETYRILTPDEFTETFELSAPGKEYVVYALNRFQRVSHSIQEMV